MTTAVGLAPGTGLLGFMPRVPRSLVDLIGTNTELLFRYAGAGSIGTVAHFAVLYAMLGFVGPVAATTLGAVTGCIVNFLLSHHFVFPGRRSGRRAFPRFVAIAAFGVVLNAVMMKALITSLPILLSQVISTAAVFLFTFAFNSGWTFSERQI